MTILDVKGMTCGHCVKAVTAAIQALDARARVDVDLAQGIVRVESTSDAGTIAHAIVEAGYEAAPRG